MKNAIVAFFVGLLFAVGLVLAGMTQPQKIVGFLDVFGDWDPSLLFVMVGAIAVHFFSYRLIRRRPSPLLSTHWHIPSSKEITPALVIGSLLFGIGWGLGGFCPGPALVSAASLDSTPVIFVFSMIAGMVLYRIIGGKLKIG